jgi:4-amino-4-deoxy-L-arabinose transferase-like glycosyltransferase
MKNFRKFLTKNLYALSAVLFFGLFVFQLWFHVVRTSATIDEVPHILAGYRHLQCGDFGINPEHPPLLKIIAALPLMSQDLIQPQWDCGSKITEKYDAWFAGFSFLTDNGADNIIIPARLATSIISILLIVLITLATREMFGRTEALIALILFAFEPTIIAHGALVTTDMAVSVGLFASVFLFYRYRKNPTFARLVLVGIAVGWTLSSKHSGIIVLPILFLLLVADVLFFSGIKFSKGLFVYFIRQLAAFTGIVLIAFTLLWACYGFRYSALPNRSENVISIDDFFMQLKMPQAIGSQSGETVKFISQTHLLPESYTLGLADLVATSRRPTYFFGEVMPNGVWFYFPIAFSIKSSIALLALFPLGLITFPLYRERGREMLFLLLPSLLFFAISLTSEINIGIRHILPVYAFFIVVAASGAYSAAQKSKRDRYGLILLLLFHIVTAAWIAPDYLPFSNDIWGGPSNTYKYLSDSNVDWGQNIKLVNEYLQRENIKDCWFANFGGGGLAQSEQPCRLLPGGFGWNFSDKPIDAVPPVIEGIVLISTNVAPPYRNSAEYLSITEKAKPLAQIGSTILVYQGRFEIPLAAASSHLERCEQLNRIKRYREAIEECRLTIKLIPNNIQAHFLLGAALSKAQESEEARREFEKTIEMTKTHSGDFRNLILLTQNELNQLK